MRIRADPDPAKNGPYKKPEFFLNILLRLCSPELVLLPYLLVVGLGCDQAGGGIRL